MCTRAEAQPWVDVRPAVNLVRIARVVTEGTIVGTIGAVSFAIVHAMLIVPIWGRIPGGMVQAVPAGVALAWAFERVAPARNWRSSTHGAIFGALLFLTLVPGTVFANTLRLAGAHPGDWPGTIGTLAIAAASGGFAGWILTRERRAPPAFAIATFVLTAAAGGPVAVVNSARAAWLFIGFLPICVAAGTATTLARRVVRKDMS
jgi:hypothetical protein